MRNVTGCSDRGQDGQCCCVLEIAHATGDLQENLDLVASDLSTALRYDTRPLFAPPVTCNRQCAKRSSRAGQSLFITRECAQPDTLTASWESSAVALLAAAGLVSILITDAHQNQARLCLMLLGGAAAVDMAAAGPFAEFRSPLRHSWEPPSAASAWARLLAASVAACASLLAATSPAAGGTERLSHDPAGGKDTPHTAKLGGTAAGSLVAHLRSLIEEGSEQGSWRQAQ